MVKKKFGQMKIQQMAFMLMAVMLFFVLVGMLVIVIWVSGLKETSEILEEENSMLLVTKLANSPEFACGSSFGSSRLSCIDFDKVMALENYIDEYEGFWGIAEIEIRIVYPESEVVCTSENYPDCGIIEVYSEDVDKLASYSNFVALCGKDSDGSVIYEQCRIALLMVSSEDKT